jgi:hypothetical protein
MKCTECNRTLKPVVALDIDGTMGMYHEHFLFFASGYLNQQIKDHYVGNQPFKEWFCTNYNCTVDVWHDIKLAYRQGGMKRTMPVYTDARTLAESVRAAGAELWVTTTRPYIRHDNIDPDTREWLRRNRIHYDYMIYDGQKYRKLDKLVGAERVCAVLDDLVEEIDEAESMFGHDVPILRRNGFNKAQHRQHIMQATSLLMAERLIRDKIKQWKGQHDGPARSVQRDDQPDTARSDVEVQEQVK